MVHEEENILFVSEDSSLIEETTESYMEALTLDDFALDKFTSLGMIISGTGIMVSILVLGILSIIRTR